MLLNSIVRGKAVYRTIYFLPVVVLYLYVVKLTFVYDPTPFVLGFVLASVVI